MQGIRMKAMAFAIAMCAIAPSVQAARQGDAADAGRMDGQQRAQSIRQFVLKWGAYVEHTYGLDSHTWAMRLVPEFATGDASNIRNALKRQTYEGALAELDGRGLRLSDDQVITKMASQPMATAALPVAELLGDTTGDLVYTPITPCRIADTRNMGAGAIPANTSRDFGAWGWGSYTAWGGSATNCGMLNEHPTSVVLNVTAVTPTAAGYATVYAGDLGAPPLVASVNYGAGDIVNNSVVANINPGTSPDFKIYSYAQSHYVVDIIGFYDSPHATPLQAQKVEATASVASNAGSGFNSPVCPAGYTLTGGGCGGAFATDIVVRSEPSDTSWYCYVKAGPSATTAYAWGQCSRVPGR